LKKKNTFCGKVGNDTDKEFQFLILDSQARDQGFDARLGFRVHRGLFLLVYGFVFKN